MAKRSSASTAADQAKPASAPAAASSSPAGGEASSSPSGAKGAAPPAATGAAAGSPAADANLAGDSGRQGNGDEAGIAGGGLGPGGRIIMVRSTSDRGRRRAGLAFGPIPTPVCVDDLTDEQVASLASDPQLIVSLDD